MYGSLKFEDVHGRYVMAPVVPDGTQKSARTCFRYSLWITVGFMAKNKRSACCWNGTLRAGLLWPSIGKYMSVFSGTGKRSTWQTIQSSSDSLPYFHSIGSRGFRTERHTKVPFLFHTRWQSQYHKLRRVSKAQPGVDSTVYDPCEQI